VWAWSAYFDLIPKRVEGIDNVVEIAQGNDFTLARKNDGTVWAWGGNDYGQLGDGTTVTRRTTPQQVVGLTNVTSISAGLTHALARLADGRVMAWGENGSGQLGDGTTTNRSRPVAVAFLTAPTVISAGDRHSGAVLTDGRVLAWGDNGYGELG